MGQRARLKVRSIPGYYFLQIILNPPDKRHRDLGNFEKVCSDFAQAAGIIENDSLCRQLVIVYGSALEAPLGVRLEFRSVSVPAPRGREQIDRIDEL